PHTREGCDSEGAAKSMADTMISIHTPAKGATPDYSFVISPLVISIHTPAKGATVNKLRLYFYHFVFFCLKKF
ncbi:MAG: hypothetical protein WAQ18_09330, partial [Methanosarcina flavescens]